MNNIVPIYGQFLEKWADYFLTNSVEILFLAIPAAIFSLLFQKKSPRFHYILWTIVLLKTLIPSDILKIIRSSPEPIYTIELPAVITTTYSQTIASTINQYQNILFILWGLVVIFLLMKLILNSMLFRRILFSKKRIDINNKISNHYNLKKDAQVFIANIDVPFTVGFIKPKIFLPKNSDNDNMNFILAHEMAHIKRHDFLMIMIQNFITMIFFFHPVVLIASGFLNYYRELICDDMAVEAINSSPKKYGRKIIDYLEFCLRQKKYPILANGFIFSKKIFVKRIEYLINRKDNVVQKLSKFQVALIMTLVLVMVFILACETVVGPSKSVEPAIQETIPATEIEKPSDPKVKFIPYETAPEPIGGFAAIQKNIVYPKIAQEAGVEGVVVIQTFINKNGNATYFEIMKGLPNTGLDECAIAAITKTKFTPATDKDGVVGVWISIPVVFKLNNKSETQEQQVNQKLKQEAIEVTLDSKLDVQAKIRQPHKIEIKTKSPRFIPYDQAPEPIGGFEDIQKRVVYPEIPHDARIEGTVVVQAFVDKNGNVTETNIIKGIPNTGLDEAAIDAVNDTKFKPAKQRNETVGVWVSIPIVFKLNK